MSTSGSGTIGAVASGYPTGADLIAFLENAGLTLTAGQMAAAEEVVAAGIATFEKAVGRKMLAGDSETRRYDPPTGYVDGMAVLFCDDLAALTSVQYQPQGSSASTYVLDEEVFPEPYNALARTPAIPYTRLSFRQRWCAPVYSSLRRSILITGRFGYALALPADVFQAMLIAGALGLWGQVNFALTGGRLSWKDDDAAEDFGVEPSANLMKQWQMQYDRTVAQYRKVTF